MKHDDIIIYCDGSSLGNPGPGGWGTVIVLSKENKVLELGGHERETTNNRMELTAAIEALLAIKDIPGKTIIHTDSAYVLNGITSWVYGWQAKGWMTIQKTEVLNRDLWQKLVLEADFRKENGGLAWVKVKGHSGILANERADVLATSFADQNPVEYFRGTPAGYETFLGGSVHAVSPEAGRSAKRSSSGKKAYSYLSLVDGVLERHKTWADCERRVKGIAGVKFKKALSAADEEMILAEWGIR